MYRFVSVYHDPDDEPIGQEYKNLYENETIDINEWKLRIFNEIQSFIPRLN